ALRVGDKTIAKQKRAVAVEQVPVARQAARALFRGLGRVVRGTFQLSQRDVSQKEQDDGSRQQGLCGEVQSLVALRASRVKMLLGPGGAIESSPAIYRWVGVRRKPTIKSRRDDRRHRASLRDA